MSHTSEYYCCSCRPLHNLVDASPVKQRDYPTERTLPVLLLRSGV
jgi:hypothetical protein